VIEKDIRMVVSGMLVEWIKPIFR